jgi:hypothetical protein
MAKTLRDKLKPTLVADGVFYPTPLGENIEPLIILEEVKEKAGFTQSHMNNSGYLLGFRAYHKLTSEPYGYEALISKGIGNPKIYLIIDNGISVDYSTSINLAKDKAHGYLFNKIVDEELLHCSDVYTNLLDITKIGIRKAKKNKVNLSANENKSFGIIVDKSKATRTCNMRITPFSKGSRLNH